MTVLERIKEECRIKKNMSITTLEQELGYSNGSLAKVKDIPSSRILEISEYLGVSMYYLMKGYVVYEVNPEWKELEFSYKNWVANSTKVATFVVTPEQYKKKQTENNIEKYKQELERLNKMFLKGRINEKYYDEEYLRINELISQIKTNTKPEGHIINIQEKFYDSWKEMYNELDKLGKKLFWRGIIKEIIVDENMNVIDVIFL